MNWSSMVIDQCLFGYEDGHRLLASSMQLGEEQSDLTELSDLAPGVVFSGSNGYWTGIPAPKIGRYALMRTWPAPEMPRPGCVWTHALLLEPSVLENLSDLSALSRLFSRPNNHLDQNRYKEKLILENTFTESPFQWSTNANRVLQDLLVALYDLGQVSVPVTAPEEADAPLFALWSQQWPRLRRNFRFQTAVTREQRPASSGKLDVYLQLEEDIDMNSRPVNADWVKAAADDVIQGPKGKLRLFLWRYGADVRRQRGSFRPLVNIELLRHRYKSDTGSKLLKLVTDAFPDRNDAIAIKQDIVDGILIPRAQLDVLSFVLARGDNVVFPSPSKAGISRLAKIWPDRPQDLLELAERTADSEDELGRSVFESIAGAVPTEEFWSLTKSYPRVQDRMVTARPELLGSDSALNLDNRALVAFINIVAPDNPVGLRLVPKVLSRDDSRLAKSLIDRHPQEVALEVISALNSTEITVGSAWLEELIQRPDILLNPEVFGRIKKTSLLFDLAERLGWLSEPMISAGTQPWTCALAKAKNDLPAEKYETLEAFLIGLALACGGDGGRQLLEQFFAEVHDLILKARLPWRAFNILSPNLPDVGWIRSWDMGLRLRLAVARSYVQNDYPSESYAALSKSENVRSMLAEVASEIIGGERLAQAASRF
jgi:hypothetical protein